ncbi:MAG: DUF1800 domain-containing protein [Gemmatimonadaceae bacterium]
MIDRRAFLQLGSALAASSMLACDRLPPWLLAQQPAFDDAAFAPPVNAHVDLVSHVIARLSYGARPGEYARVRALGRSQEAAVDAYIREQLAPEALEDAHADAALRQLSMLELPAGELFEFKAPVLLESMTRGTLVRTLLSTRQLHEVMVEFWSDHFNIDSSKGDCRWLKAHDDRVVVRANAMDSFAALLRASALSPAMLWYLDGRVNRRTIAGEKPNENYARELFELHTLGVHGGYTQQDVMEAARALTGWTVRAVGESSFGLGRVEFIPERHDDGEKVILGQRIAAGGGAQDIDRLVEIVCAHPATATHIATKLCRRFIDDDPPADAVRAVADTFRRGGGDIRPTLHTLFSTPDFLASRQRKLKRPLHFVVSALRVTGAVSDAGPALQEYLTRMGHAPFQYPTPDGYPDEASAWTGTLLWRWNFAMALQRNRIHGTQVDLASLERRAGGRRHLAAHVLGRQPTPHEWAAHESTPDTLALLLASPAFQRT